MRKALEFPRIDEGKLDAVEALIAAIADKEPGTAGAELEDLAALTGKVHTDVEFAEYWSWTDLDTLARLTLTPEPPCIPDLSREELVELVEIIQHCSVTGREWAMRYYTALLRRSLSLPNVMDFVASGEDVEVIAEKLLQAHAVIASRALRRRAEGLLFFVPLLPSACPQLALRGLRHGRKMAWHRRLCLVLHLAPPPLVKPVFLHGV